MLLHTSFEPLRWLGPWPSENPDQTKDKKPPYPQSNVAVANALPCRKQNRSRLQDPQLDLMFERRIPEWLRHAPAPSVHGFGVLAGFEGITRGMLISVFPLAMYNALGDAVAISQAYFFIGIGSLIVGLLVPALNKRIPRRWLYSFGTLCFIAGALLASLGTPMTLIFGLMLNSFATVITFICFNAYVLDYIKRIELGRSETLRLLYSALGWTLGPAVGVALYTYNPVLPFYISAASSLGMLAAFTYMRLGNGKLITRAKRPAPNPLAFIGRFVQQPRLVAGFSFAVIRSCGWWAYIVYMPLYALKNGLPEQLGGFLMSGTNAALFLAPFMLRWMQKRSVRIAVRTGFAMAASFFTLAFLLADWPWVVIVTLFCASFFLILLDISAGLPFLMAVKPSERTEMSTIYSSYRDVSGILTPGFAWGVLLVAPISGVFLLAGAALAIAYTVAGSVHPRLGEKRLVAAE